MGKKELKKGRYMELSEKERFLRELVGSTGQIAQKRDIGEKNVSELNVKKGGLREL
ncbi:MAG: hypothetical protein ABH840_02190 [Nanoarchaeota archaeon]